MTNKCDYGRENRCPYQNSCRSDSGLQERVRPDGLWNPNQLWNLSIRLTANHEVWINKEALYICKPEHISETSRTILEEKMASMVTNFLYKK